ncbi:MAG: dihydrolipoyl dehydrogenase, partial [Arenicellales bacterium]|nr:dihydrolipoyl dehydrogenase [Arenicellales bacterium]
TLLHAAKVINEAKEMNAFGVAFSTPDIDIDKLRKWKEKVTAQLTTGLAGLAKQRGVEVIKGEARFTGPHQLAVTTN